MSGWDIATLGEVTNNFDFRRVPVKRADRIAGSYPYYGASGVVDHVNDYIFDGEYLLIAEDGENLKSRQLPIAFLANGKFWVNNHAHIVQANQRSDTRYLMYAVENLDISPYTTGTTVPKLSQASLNSIPIPLPPLPIQRRIAAILGRLDDKIEVNRRLNATLEAMAQALYQQWFVDFAPFQDGPFVESELGPIPAGWEVRLMSSVVELLGGGTPKTSVEAYWNGEIDWVAAKDVAAGSPFVMTTERTITPLGVENSSAKLLSPFTTVITARGTVGECGLLPWDMAINQSNYGIRGAGLGPFTTYLMTLNAVEYLQQHAYGTVFDTITRKTFDAIKAVAPPIDVWDAFENQVAPWFQQMLTNQEQNVTLAATRDYLLPRLLSGEIAVDDVALEDMP